MKADTNPDPFNPAPAEPAPEPLEDMTIAQLITLGNDRDIEVPTSGRKGEIISALREAGVKDPK